MGEIQVLPGAGTPRNAGSRQMFFLTPESIVLVGFRGSSMAGANSSDMVCHSGSATADCELPDCQCDSPISNA
jgi:hypothetical protein